MMASKPSLEASISPGLVADWNKENPDLAALPHDRAWFKMPSTFEGVQFQTLQAHVPTRNASKRLPLKRAEQWQCRGITAVNEVSGNIDMLLGRGCLWRVMAEDLGEAAQPGQAAWARGTADGSLRI